MAGSSQRSMEKIHLRSRSDYFVNLGLETVYSDGHLRSIERVLHHCIRVCFVNLLQRCIRAGVCWGSEKDELDPCSGTLLVGWYRNDGYGLTCYRKEDTHLESLCLDYL